MLNIEKFMIEVNHAPAGSEEVTSSALSLTYKDPESNFFDRIRVLDDLTHGQPPRWPASKVEDRLDAEAKLLKMDIKDKEAQTLMAGDARFMWRAYWIAFAVAFFIPIMVVLTKWLLPRELSDYYSRRFQHEIGNPDFRLSPLAGRSARGGGRRA
jgi:hypothetical protein